MCGQNPFFRKRGVVPEDVISVFVQGGEVVEEAVTLESGYALMPHPLKAYRGGEDVQVEFSAGGHTIFGVFDGVGGWADLGVDPALYARKMGDLIRREFEKDPQKCVKQERPLINLLEAVSFCPLPSSVHVLLSIVFTRLCNVSVKSHNKAFMWTNGSLTS